MKFGKKSLFVQFFYIDQNKETFEYCIIFFLMKKEGRELSDHFIAKSKRQKQEGPQFF